MVRVVVLWLGGGDLVVGELFRRIDIVGRRILGRMVMVALFGVREWCVVDEVLYLWRRGTEVVVVVDEGRGGMVGRGKWRRRRRRRVVGVVVMVEVAFQLLHLTHEVKYFRGVKIRYRKGCKRNLRL